MNQPTMQSALEQLRNIYVFTIKTPPQHDSISQYAFVVFTAEQKSQFKKQYLHNKKILILYISVLSKCSLFTSTVFIVMIVSYTLYKLSSDDKCMFLLLQCNYNANAPQLLIRIKIMSACVLLGQSVLYVYALHVNFLQRSISELRYKPQSYDSMRPNSLSLKLHHN